VLAASVPFYRYVIESGILSMMVLMRKTQPDFAVLLILKSNGNNA